MAAWCGAGRFVPDAVWTAALDLEPDEVEFCIVQAMATERVNQWAVMCRGGGTPRTEVSATAAVSAAIPA
jgi:hypothetical protein